MHSFTGSSGVTFNHNSDRSGDVRISVVGGEWECEISELAFDSHELGGRVVPAGTKFVEVKLPCKDILEWVADYIRSERVAELENAEDAEILGVPIHA